MDAKWLVWRFKGALLRRSRGVFSEGWLCGGRCGCQGVGMTVSLCL